MTKEQIFSAWSPENSIWAIWAKAVLFAHLDRACALPPTGDIARDVDWSPISDGKIALVLDLPGQEGVWLGVALASRGYRPVPLYNALPLPFGVAAIDPMSQRPVAAVNVLPILSALRQGAEQLANASIASDAPPAFLLDANRHGITSQVSPDEFDNRSVCFTTDFPSANFLLTHGIERALLIQRNRLEPQTDLAHVLRRWQDGGLSIERMRIERPMERESFEVTRPSWYGAMFQRALAAFGLYRASGGGFGAWMPDSSSGG